MWAPWCIALLLALVPLPLAAQAAPPASPSAEAIAPVVALREPAWPAADPLPGAQVAPLRLVSEPARAPSLARSVGWGALAGASAGLVTGLAVLWVCDSYCDGQEAVGVALHVGVGSAAGAALGGLLHWIRR